MINLDKQLKKNQNLLNKQRSYSEIVDYLDEHWTKVDLDKTKQRVLKLDNLLKSPSKSLASILVTGTNGKSLTANFITKLCTSAGLQVGSFYSPHILSYEERISLNNKYISSKIFTELANTVINTCETSGIIAHSLEILSLIIFLYFKQNKTDLVILESSENQAWDPVSICKTKVVAITRVTDNSTVVNSKLIDKKNPKPKENLINIASLATKDSTVISADQSKLNLQTIQEHVQAQGAKWAMPIRKLISLPYPFEQLHGRCAALAERSAQIFMENYLAKDKLNISENILVKPKGQRGRPTLETKKQLELNPKKTLEQFWKDCYSNLKGRFELLNKEKPTLLLDNASNLDALSNVLLGTRLLHYQKSLQGLAIIVACEDNEFDSEEFIKTIRYFFRKTSGQIIFCPLSKKSPYKKNSWTKSKNWDYKKITDLAKNAKIKAKSAQNFSDAFEMATKSVDDRYGLVVITGSKSIISEYWSNKGLKKII